MIERSVKLQKYEISDNTDLTLSYGVEDSIPPSTISFCAGCGSNFQCNSHSLPGFLPVKIFNQIEEQSKRFPGFSEHLCRRCHLIKKHNFLVIFLY